MDLVFRIAEQADAAALNRALQRLSDDLGDRHRARPADLERAGWGAAPTFRAVLAERAGEIVGVALYSPLFSTTRGGAGLYVSDLWTAPQLRGQRIASRLLGAALADGRQLWDARFLKLSVYDTSTRARRFYDHLGFVSAGGLSDLVLDEAGCAALRGAE